MKPVVFDGCFGWLHEAHGPMGVVLCRPLGNEDITTHRGWAALAEALAARGLPTLRFDYTGSGDSAGAEDGPAAVRPMLDAIRAAAGFLRQQAGVRAVALCGLRLGSALAFLAARELGGVAALAMLAPVVSGRTWSRELRAAASGSSLAALDPPPAAEGDAPLNSNGFPWRRDVLRGIEAINLDGAGPLPAPRVLLMPRRPSKPVTVLAEQLRQAGAAVEERIFAGYAGYVEEHVADGTPDADWAALADWLAAGAADAASADPVPARVAPVLALDGARETPLCFGANGALFGMLCEPAPRGSTVGGDFAVVMLNTGTAHHVGNGGLLVALARRLARQGIASLRMDVAGMGDSAARPGEGASPLYNSGNPDDVRAALDMLEARGVRRVLLAGLCAGAFTALHAALREPRVVAVAAVNLQKFIWVEGTSLDIALRQSRRSLRSYLRSLGNPGEWRRLLRGEADVPAIAGALLRGGGRRLGVMLRDAVPPRPGSDRWVVRSWLRQLAGRTVAVRFVFGDDDPGLTELAAFFGRDGRALRALPGVEVVRLAESDHNLNASDARARFTALFERFAAEVAGDAAPKHEGDLRCAA